jgi:deoxyribose-phosphate aldolase
MTVLTVADVTYQQVAKTIDHSLLRPELTLEEIRQGCELAARYDVASVCARPADVSLCRDILGGSSVAVGTVVGFPHGSSTTATKIFEAERALEDGATELDMVINIGWLRSGENERVESEIRSIVAVAAGKALVKVILENVYLDDNQKVTGSKLVELAGADFVKTSTGFASGGATLEDLKLMRGAVSHAVQVKAAGGVRSLDDLLGVMSLGVTRAGATRTASILDDYVARSKG